MRWPRKCKPDGSVSGAEDNGPAPDDAPPARDEESGVGSGVGDVGRGGGGAGGHGRLEPSRRLTGHQFFYLFILDGLGSFVLSGGINFGIAYAMYTTQNTNKNPIRLFQLANTLAGDGVVTIFVQCLVTWLVETMLVAHDVRHGSVQAIGWIREPRHWLARSLFMLPADPRLGAPPLRVSGVGPLARLLVRGLLFGLAAFVPFWPVSVGIMAAVGQRRGDGDWYYGRVWAPEVYKLLLGGLLGLATTPPMALYWLARGGWESQTALRYAQEAAVRYAEEAAEGAARGEEGVEEGVGGWMAPIRVDRASLAESVGDLMTAMGGVEDASGVKEVKETTGGAAALREDDAEKKGEQKVPGEVGEAPRSATERASKEGEVKDADNEKALREVEKSPQGTNERRPRAVEKTPQDTDEKPTMAEETKEVKSSDAGSHPS